MKISLVSALCAVALLGSATLALAENEENMEPSASEISLMNTQHVFTDTMADSNDYIDIAY